MEDLTKLVFHFLNVLQLRHSLCTVVTSGDVNPLSGDVVRHRLHARSDHAVLSNLLKSAVPDERGDGELPHFEGMLLEAVVNGRESPHRSKRTVESHALLDGRSKRDRQTEMPPNVFDGLNGIHRPRRNVKLNIHVLEHRELSLNVLATLCGGKSFSLRLRLSL